MTVITVKKYVHYAIISFLISEAYVCVILG